MLTRKRAHHHQPKTTTTAAATELVHWKSLRRENALLPRYRTGSVWRRLADISTFADVRCAALRCDAFRTNACGVRTCALNHINDLIYNERRRLRNATQIICSGTDTEHTNTHTYENTHRTGPDKGDEKHETTLSRPGNVLIEMCAQTGWTSHDVTARNSMQTANTHSRDQEKCNPNAKRRTSRQMPSELPAVLESNTMLPADGVAYEYSALAEHMAINIITSRKSRYNTMWPPLTLLLRVQYSITRNRLTPDIDAKAREKSECSVRLLFCFFSRSVWVNLATAETYGHDKLFDTHKSLESQPANSCPDAKLAQHKHTQNPQPLALTFAKVCARGSAPRAEQLKFVSTERSDVGHSTPVFPVNWPTSTIYACKNAQRTDTTKTHIRATLQRSRRTSRTVAVPDYRFVDGHINVVTTTLKCFLYICA